MNKIMIGGGIALGSACAILFFLLLSAQESIGNLESDLATATEVNDGNIVVIEGLRQAQEDLINGMAAEAVLEERAEKERRAQLENLRRELDESRARLAAALEGLSDDDAVCAKSTVPDRLIDSLYAGKGRGSD